MSPAGRAARHDSHERLTAPSPGEPTRTAREQARGERITEARSEARNEARVRPSNGHDAEVTPVKALMKRWLAQVAAREPTDPLRYATLVCVGDRAFGSALRAALPADEHFVVVTSASELARAWNEIDVAISVVILGGFEELGAVEAAMVAMSRWPQAPLLWASRNGTPELPIVSRLRPTPLTELMHAELAGRLCAPCDAAKAILAFHVRGKIEREEERRDAVEFAEQFGVERDLGVRYTTLASHRIPRLVARTLCDHDADEMLDFGRNYLYSRAGVWDYEGLLGKLAW